MADYILPISSSGNVDFKQLTYIKHPLQAFLGRYFRGQPIEIKILRDERKLLVKGYHGKLSDLQEAISRANERQKEHAHGQPITCSEEDLQEVEVGKVIDIVPEDLKQDILCLEQMFQAEQDVCEAEIGALEIEKHKLEGRLKFYEKEVNNLGRANAGLQETNKNYSRELGRARIDVKKSQETVEHLSKVIDGLSKLSGDPLEVMYSIIEKASAELAKHDKILDFIAGEKNIEEVLQAGAKSFYQLVNERLNTNYTSDSQIPTNIEPFEQKEPEKTSKYNALPEAFAAIENLRINPWFGETISAETLAAKETELKNFKEAYEKERAEYEQNLKVAQGVAGLKEFHNNAVSLVAYKEKELKEPVKVPVLITRQSGATKYVLPNCHLSGLINDYVEQNVADASAALGPQGLIERVSAADPHKIRDVFLDARDKLELLKIGFELDLTVMYH